MSFTIILENGKGKEIERCVRHGNENFLIQESEDFPLLSNLNLFSYDVFSSAQASQLREELLTLHGKLKSDEDRLHVAELAQIALTCSELEDSVITFTPFER